DMLATWFRDLLIWKNTQEPELMINGDVPEQIRLQSQGFSAQRLEENLAAIERTKSYLRSNVNNRLALNNLFMDLWGG
ncbi:MAG TPA: DNA polymerase III subunit delta' C-terminal domain-containing protein, partial [Bacillota bacterium]|nr:DNA polymerase III subunit delta' C-terminal domain-containing protein [Bacillota bacterium]